MSRSALSTVASPSRITGVAWTAATLTVGNSVTSSRSYAPGGGIFNRAGHPVALGAPPRGQPLRGAAVGRALRPRPPRGRGRAVRLARPRARGPRAGQGDEGRPGRPVRPTGLRQPAGRRPEPALQARWLGVAAARRVEPAGGVPRAGSARLLAGARAIRAERFVGGPPPLARAQRGHLPLDHRALRL